VAKIGYARVSTLDQDYATQEERLRAAGCAVVRCEKVSGKSREGRDELAGVLEFIRPSDELVVVKLDRLGRSIRDVLNLVHELEQKGAALRVLEPEFCTSTDTGRIPVTVLGMVAEMERRFILDRQRVGIEKAKADGKYKGRKAFVPSSEVRRLNEARGHRNHAWRVPHERVAGAERGGVSRPKNPGWSKNQSEGLDLI
jgi:DNA invertase Pin-like site-specific DNA recombinase